MSIKVNVTADDIKNGKQGDSGNCAIARALKAMGYSNVDVQFEHAFVVAPGATEVEIFRLPTEATKFVQDFDYGGDVAPAVFALTPNTYFATVTA